MNEKESITKGSYHLNIALQYFQDFKRDCRTEAKRRAGTWVDKINFVINDVCAALTPASRERFRQEITQSQDPIFMQAISEKILHLDNDRRDMLETIIDGLLNGEEIKITHEETQR